MSSWHFDHLVAANPAFEPFSWIGRESPYIDISEGFDAYVSQRSSTRGNVRGIVSEYGQKKRKLEREIGPVRFEWHVADRSILNTMIEWKSEQYRRTKMDNIFVFPWVVNLLNKIMEFDSPHIAPVMSVTYVADKIAAINFGMRAGDVLHPWFPAYNVDFGKYSPGTLHWVATLQAAESMGVRRIDLVSGGETYKQRFMSGSIRVLRGAVDLRPSVAARAAPGGERRTSSAPRRSMPGCAARCACYTTSRAGWSFAEQSRPFTMKWSQTDYDSYSPSGWGHSAPIEASRGFVIAAIVLVTVAFVVPLGEAWQRSTYDLYGDAASTEDAARDGSMARQLGMLSLAGFGIASLSCPAASACAPTACWARSAWRSWCGAL